MQSEDTIGFVGVTSCLIIRCLSSSLSVYLVAYKLSPSLITFNNLEALGLSFSDTCPACLHLHWNIVYRDIKTLHTSTPSPFAEVTIVFDCQEDFPHRRRNIKEDVPPPSYNRNQRLAVQNAFILCPCQALVIESAASNAKIGQELNAGVMFW